MAETIDEYAGERGFTLPPFMKVTEGNDVSWDKAHQLDAEAFLYNFCAQIKAWGPPGLE